MLSSRKLLDKIEKEHLKLFISKPFLANLEHLRPVGCLFFIVTLIVIAYIEYIASLVSPFSMVTLMEIVLLRLRT